MTDNAPTPLDDWRRREQQTSDDTRSCAILASGEQSMTQSPELQQIKETLRTELPRLSRSFAVREIGIFGSWVRGQQEDDSDLDIWWSSTPPQASSDS